MVSAIRGIIRRFYPYFIILLYSLVIAIDISINDFFYIYSFLVPLVSIIMVLLLGYIFLCKLLKNKFTALIYVSCFSYVFFQFDDFLIYFPSHLALLYQAIILAFIIIFPLWKPNSAKTLHGYFTLWLTIVLGFNGYDFASALFIKRYDVAALYKNDDWDYKKIENSNKLPDIYYILPDGYANNHALKEIYNYDNQPFINQLENKGFKIFPCSQSAYPYTLLSGSATLNMQYVQSDLNKIEDHYNDRTSILPYFANSRLVKLLKHNDYKIEALAYVMPIEEETLNEHQTISLDGENNGILKYLYNAKLLNKMPIYPLLNRIFDEEKNPLNPYIKYRDNLIKRFSEIEEGLSRKYHRPRFSFMHFLIPHPPFVFDENGDYVKNGDIPLLLLDGFEHGYHKEWESFYIGHYPKQLQYTNSALLKIIDSIQQKSSRPYVIIIQSDHGSRLHMSPRELEENNFNELYPSFNAVYYSDEDYTNADINNSNVNMFRMILNKYFDYSLPLLPKRSYFSPFSKIFDFQDVTERVDFCDN